MWEIIRELVADGVTIFLTAARRYSRLPASVSCCLVTLSAVTPRPESVLAVAAEPRSSPDRRAPATLAPARRRGVTLRAGAGRFRSG
jgi:hypothetical protein